MRLYTFLFFLCAALFFNTNVKAQDTSQEVVQMQPRIMVIPFAKEGENVRTVLEDDIVRRVAVTKVMEGFDNRGFTTIDFIAKLKAAELDGVITSNSQTDLNTQIAQYAGADIYAEIEAYYDTAAVGATSVRVIIKGYDAFTGASMGSKTGESSRFQTTNYSKLVEKALLKKEGNVQINLIEEFLNVMQSKFLEINENGRPIKIIFSVDQNASYSFDSEVDGDPIKYKIEDWIDENAFKNNYTPASSLGEKITFDQVRIPLRKQGRNYTPNKFGREIRKAMRSIRLDEDPDTRLDIKVETLGGALYVTFK